MGCGACKGLVTDVVEWACGGAADVDPSADYYVPGVPMPSPNDAGNPRRGLRSVSSVFQELAGGQDDPVSKPGLASLLSTMWHDE